MMTLDVSRETWDNMIFAARRELASRDETDRVVENSIRAALRVLMIDLTTT